MPNYKPNSYKSRSETANNQKKQVKKVVNGSAKVKKKNEARKLADVFLSEDISSVKSYILGDVLIPAIKKAVSDVVTNGIDMLLYGETGRSNHRTTNASRTSYGRYFNNSEEYKNNRTSSVAMTGFDYEELIFEHRGDAEAVLYALDDLISEFGVANIGDLFDLADVSLSNYAAYKYGWHDIQGGKVIRIREGYGLKLPRPRPLN